jgi:hypothetical protein
MVLSTQSLVEITPSCKKEGQRSVKLKAFPKNGEADPASINQSYLSKSHVVQNFKSQPAARQAGRRKQIVLVSVT